MKGRSVVSCAAVLISKQASPPQGGQHTSCKEADIFCGPERVFLEGGSVDGTSVYFSTVLSYLLS